jgi:hypothetical protein
MKKSPFLAICAFLTATTLLVVQSAGAYGPEKQVPRYEQSGSSEKHTRQPSPAYPQNPARPYSAPLPAPQNPQLVAPAQVHTPIGGSARMQAPQVAPQNAPQYVNRHPEYHHHHGHRRGHYRNGYDNGYANGYARAAVDSRFYGRPAHWVPEHRIWRNFAWQIVPGFFANIYVNAMPAPLPEAAPAYYPAGWMWVAGYWFWTEVGWTWQAGQWVRV